MVASRPPIALMLVVGRRILALDAEMRQDPAPHHQHEGERVLGDRERVDAGGVADRDASGLRVGDIQYRVAVAGGDQQLEVGQTAEHGLTNRRALPHWQELPRRRGLTGD